MLAAAGGWIRISTHWLMESNRVTKSCILYVSELPSDPEEIQSYIDTSAASGGYTFSNSILVEETYNENGIFFLLYTSSWFMGGWQAASIPPMSTTWKPAEP